MAGRGGRGHEGKILREDVPKEQQHVLGALMNGENQTCLINCTWELSPTTKSRVGKDCGNCASRRSSK